MQQWSEFQSKELAPLKINSIARLGFREPAAGGRHANSRLAVTRWCSLLLADQLLADSASESNSPRLFFASSHPILEVRNQIKVSCW